MTAITRELAEQLYREHHTPPNVIAHCGAVAETAVLIGEALNRAGARLSLDVIRGAALLHDVLRTGDCHGERGALLVSALGYEEEAEIIRCHMVYDIRKTADSLQEVDVVCLADRMVKEDRYVGIEERMAYILAKWKDNPEARQRIRMKMAETKELVREIENRIGCSIGSLHVRHKLESLLKTVEKPGRYIGGELNSVLKTPEPGRPLTRFGFAFPDTYEIGMSYLGLQILYGVLNREPGVFCERIFAPAPDMEEKMRQSGVPLFTLETKTPAKEMDFLGFTLQYEMSYTNILNMLELAGMPLLREERGDGIPLVVGGGPCAFNPEPLADFFDCFLLGDGEELLPLICREYRAYEDECRRKEAAAPPGEPGDSGEGETDPAVRNSGRKRKEGFLKRIASVPGVYVPGFYRPEYSGDGKLVRMEKIWEGAPDRVRKAIVSDLETAFFPEKALVPFIEAIHDRSVVETFRGCTRGCRFCQAGMVYRPVRERSSEKIRALAETLLRDSGHEELSILSLSTSDHSEFEPMATELMALCKQNNVSLSLPSLRLDSFSFRVLEEIQGYKKSGLTFAPEAGTQRLRDVINKNITEENIMDAVSQAMELGWNSIKLYFMIGLPTETDEDLDGIAETARKIMDLNYRIRGKQGGRFSVTVSVSNFVPKPHTPFQWFGQNTEEEFSRKHAYLKERMRRIRGAVFRYHRSDTSILEAIFARGDRRTAAALLEAFRLGCKFDSWSEHFRYDLWLQALENTGTDPAFYAFRRRDPEEVLPWDHLDSGVSKAFLTEECHRAMEGITLDDCRLGCAGCGVSKYTVCPEEGRLLNGGGSRSHAGPGTVSGRESEPSAGKTASLPDEDALQEKSDRRGAGNPW